MNLGFVLQAGQIAGTITSVATSVNSIVSVTVLDVAVNVVT